MTPDTLQFLNKKFSPADCKEPLCCHSDSPAKPNARQAGYWGTRAFCDIPLRTLDLILEEAVKANPKYIIHTGDNPPHDVWSKDGAELASVNLKYMLDKLKELGFKGKLVTALGNHETFPVNVLDFHKTSVAQPFFLKYADIYGDLLDSQARSTFLKGGYYSTVDDGIRFLMVNCILCNGGNPYWVENPNDPLGQFAWIEMQLRIAEAKGEKVYVVGHIPFGHEGSSEECSLRYKALVDRFANTIRGQFFGHTHNDEMKLNTAFFDNEEVTGVMFIAPSITTYHDNFPVLRHYEAFQKGKNLKNVVNYRLEIEQADENKKPELVQILSFVEDYGVPMVSNLGAMKEFVQRLVSF